MQISPRFGHQRVEYAHCVRFVDWHYRRIDGKVFRFGKGWDQMDKVWRYYRTEET